MERDEERVRTRAYEIWEQEGRTGDPVEHWLSAEQEFSSKQAAQMTSVPCAGVADGIAAAHARNGSHRLQTAQKRQASRARVGFLAEAVKGLAIGGLAGIGLALLLRGPVRFDALALA
jgi:hypothetical protein